jgi:hypothetical protein
MTEEVRYRQGWKAIPPNNEMDTQIESTVTPTASLATLDVSSQEGISIADAANAVACPAGYGQLVIVSNAGTNSSAIFFTYSGPTVVKLGGDANFEDSTTPAAGNSGFQWDGAAAFRIYNETGLDRVYQVMVIRTL